MKEAIDQINNYLKELDQGVVGLDGYSGLGKTTISNELEKINPHIKVLHMDDFVVTSNIKEKLEPQVENKSPQLKLQWKNVGNNSFDSLRSEIEKFKTEDKDQKNILLVEGIFFFHPEILPNMFDKRILLDGNKELADERRIKREKERWGDKYFPETHPDSFARLFKIAWSRYQEIYRPAEKADLLVRV